jgi:hypothetical protein
MLHPMQITRRAPVLFEALVYLARRFVKKRIPMRNGAEVPKVIVLFSGGDDGSRQLADAAAERAKSIRFTEVDVRALGASAVAGYDGVVIVGGASHEPVIDAVLHDVAHAGEHVVIGVVADGALPGRALRMSAIFVTSGETEPAERAAAIGERVAKVAGWVRHGLGHESEGEHDHGHHHD